MYWCFQVSSFWLLFQSCKRTYLFCLWKDKVQGMGFAYSIFSLLPCKLCTKGIVKPLCCQDLYLDYIFQQRMPEKISYGSSIWTLYTSIFIFWIRLIHLLITILHMIILLKINKKKTSFMKILHDITVTSFNGKELNCALEKWFRRFLFSSILIYPAGIICLLKGNNITLEQEVKYNRS